MVIYRRQTNIFYRCIIGKALSAARDISYLKKIVAIKLSKSVRRSFSVRDVASSSPVRSSVPEIPLDKELTANCPVETHTKLEELILGAMVDYGLNRVHRPLWLQQSLIKLFLMV